MEPLIRLHPGREPASLVRALHRRIYIRPGKHVGQLNVGIGWYNTGATSQDAGNWDDLPWWEVLAGEYKGTITMTIEDMRQ